ncbi:MAG: DUF1501 domain-containing protein [Bacteroidota bacterium]
MSKHNSLRVGATLANKKAHEKDHFLHGRRSFLRNLGLVGTAGMMINKLPVAAFGSNSLAKALTTTNTDRILVMIRLKGGNDGLNTIIPLHDFGRYQTLRPDVHIPEAETTPISGSLAINNQLLPLQNLWDSGKMKVINNVGYPDQNLSHFRSSDIWATTSDAEVVVPSGWLGRYIEGEFPDFLIDPPATPPAVQIGGTGNLVFNNSDNFNYAIATDNPAQLYEIAQTGQLYDVADVPDCTYGEQLSYLRSVANTTFRYAGVLNAAYEAGANDNTAEYVNDRLGDQLALIARLIRGGLETQLYMVELDGFDTHANQPDFHAYLLNSLATNTAAFFTDLAVGGQDDRVLAMTISEFGRRPEQNGSRGTDHGSAAPLFVFGNGLNGNGILGGIPDLQDLDQYGNIRHTVDYRSVYATIMNYWLCLDTNVVNELLGNDFERVDGMGLFCETVSSTSNPARATDINLQAYLSGGQMVVSYDLPNTGNVLLRMHDSLGRVVSSPFNGRQYVGPQTMRLPLSAINWAAGVYIVSVETGGYTYSKKVGLF